MYIPEKPADLPAGEYPAVLRAACEVCEVKPEQLLSWCVKAEEVQIILPSGQKVKFVVVGKWVNPPFPWMIDNAPPAAEHMPPVGAFDLAPAVVAEPQVGAFELPPEPEGARQGGADKKKRR